MVNQEIENNAIKLYKLRKQIEQIDDQIKLCELEHENREIEAADPNTKEGQEVLSKYKKQLDKKKKYYQIQYSENREKLWVHCSDGSTVARFDTRFGMDIHNTVTDQLNGKPQCLYCTHEKPLQEDFNTFCDKVKTLFGVEIDKTKIESID